MDKLTEFNIESWHRTIENFESFNGTWYEQPLQPITILVRELAQTERAKFFQAGTSLYNFIISTVDYWGLKDEDRRVFVGPVGRGFQEFQVGYGDRNQIFISQTCDAAHLRDAVEPLLDRLWNDTRGRSTSEADKHS